MLEFQFVPLQREKTVISSLKPCEPSSMVGYQGLKVIFNLIKTSQLGNADQEAGSS